MGVSKIFLFEGLFGEEKVVSEFLLCYKSFITYKFLVGVHGYTFYYQRMNLSKLLLGKPRTPFQLFILIGMSDDVERGGGVWPRAERGWGWHTNPVHFWHGIFKTYYFITFQAKLGGSVSYEYGSFIK